MSYVTRARKTVGYARCIVKHISGMVSTIDPLIHESPHYVNLTMPL